MTSSSSPASPPSPPLARNDANGPFYRRTPFWVGVGMLAGLFLLLAGLFFFRPAWLPGEDQPTADPNRQLTAQLDIQDALNKGLEEEIRRLHALLNEDPCALQGILGVSPLERPVGPGYAPPSQPEGSDGQGVAPVDTLAPSANATGPTPAVNGTSPAPSPQQTPAPAPAMVGELMEQATVFILSAYKDQVSMGSGFMAAPGIIATNSHVAQGADAKILVGNKALGGMQPARVIAFSDNPERDYALLQLDDSLARKVPTLRIAGGASRTDRVSAWGFPGYITEIDPKLASLAQGDIKAVPDVVYSEGVVSVVLDRTPPVILHTAAISQGNSGGPLINDQGVVVGINTFIRKADQSYSQTNIALPGGDLARFMREHGVSPTEQQPGKTPSAAPNSN